MKPMGSEVQNVRRRFDAPDHSEKTGRYMAVLSTLNQGSELLLIELITFSLKAASNCNWCFPFPSLGIVPPPPPPPPHFFVIINHNILRKGKYKHLQLISDWLCITRRHQGSNELQLNGAWWSPLPTWPQTPPLWPGITLIPAQRHTNTAAAWWRAAGHAVTIHWPALRVFPSVAISPPESVGQITGRPPTLSALSSPGRMVTIWDGSVPWPGW